MHLVSDVFARKIDDWIVGSVEKFILGSIDVFNDFGAIEKF